MSSLSKINNYPLWIKSYIPKKSEEQATQSHATSLPQEHVKIGSETYYKLDNCKLRAKFAQLCLTDLVMQPFMGLAAMVTYIAIGILNGVYSLLGCDARQLWECIRLIGHAVAIPFALIALEATAIFGAIVSPHYARHVYTKIESYVYGRLSLEQGIFFKFTSNAFGTVKQVDDYQFNLDNPKLMNGSEGFLYFIKQSCTHSQQTGALVPSSRALALEITSFMDQRINDKAPPLRILEVGAGSGSFTKEILRKLRPTDHLDVVELNSGFCEILRDLCNTRTNVKVHETSILTFGENDYDLIISGLPLNAFDSGNLVRQVYTKFESLARKDAVFSQYEFMAIPKLKSLFCCGANRKTIVDILQEKAKFAGAHPAKIAYVYPNLPPARVLHYSMNT